MRPSGPLPGRSIWTASSVRSLAARRLAVAGLRARRRDSWIWCRLGVSTDSPRAWAKASWICCSVEPSAARSPLVRARCGSASRAAVSMSRSITERRSSSAASAVAVRAITRSARMPSTPSRAQASAITVEVSFGRSTSSQAARARSTISRSACSVPSKRSQKIPGYCSKAILRWTISARSAVSSGAAIVHRQPEAVEQLRAQRALFGIHRADQHETGVALGAEAVALDAHTSRRPRRRAPRRPGDRRAG